ncbi:MAG: ROK family protein [Bacteroidia bacterium]|nr:ROK family protein [Bacteroidia bacterium]
MFMNIAGMDIGGTKCAAILGRMDENGNPTVIGKKVLSTADYPNPYRLIEKLQFFLDELLDEHSVPASSVESIGISCGGPLDSVSGTILSPPNLPGWDEIPIVKLFGEKYGIPTFLQNDANACALAEWLMGAGRGTQNMVFLTFGTGMGAGLILNGKLYSGTNDLGGEVGHIRLAPDGPVGFGKAGSFEGFCSGGGIRQLAVKAAERRLKKGLPVSYCSDGNLDGINAKTVQEAADKGHRDAKAVYAKAGASFGRGLSVLIDILNPELIVVGSIYARSHNLMDKFMLRELKKEALPNSLEVCSIVPAELGEKVGDYGSIVVAMYED